jgi:uncharacterized membrane protein YbhN (UPF0104 family)
LETLTPKTSSILKRIVQWMLLVAIFIFLGRIVWENWNQVRGAHFSLRVGPLLVSTLIFIASYFIQIWAWYLITLKLGIAIPIQETLESWFYSQLGKYLPGKVWLFLSRLYLYGSKGKSKKTITVALYFETVTLVMAAGLIFLVSLFSLREIPSSYWGISPPWFIPFFILAFLFLHPKVLQETINRILGLLKRDPISISISYGETLWVFGVCVLSWGVGGIGFYLFVDSVFPVASKDFLFLTGALAISSTLGLIALFAPSGLGVREGVLVYFLSAIMPSSVAVILSILTRLWMTIIEIGMIGVVYLIDKLRKKGVEKS